MDSKLLFVKYFEGSYRAPKGVESPGVEGAESPGVESEQRLQLFKGHFLELATRAGRAEVVAAFVADGAPITENALSNAPCCQS